MNSKVDKIVGKFVSAVNSLQKEADRLDGAAIVATGQSLKYADEATQCREESGRASRIANKLNELIV